MCIRDRGWNADLSPDGKYAAFVTSMCDKKTKCPFGVIETATGKTLWTKKARQIKFTKHSVLDTKEIQISNNNKYLAVGGVDGTFILFDLKTGKVLWTKFIYGQIRGILFDKNDDFIYAGTGDRNAYKLNIKDGSIRAGFIAQELQEAQKDCDYMRLVLEDNPEKLEANEGHLIPVLVQAIKELSTKNDALAAEVEQLKSQLNN